MCVQFVPIERRGGNISARRLSLSSGRRPLATTDKRQLADRLFTHLCAPNVGPKWPGSCLAGKRLKIDCLQLGAPFGPCFCCCDSLILLSSNVLKVSQTNKVARNQFGVQILAKTE